jgi:murein DD-endopeptidase / murein LD-carboxypeptidase
MKVFQISFAALSVLLILCSCGSSRKASSSGTEIIIRSTNDETSGNDAGMRPEPLNEEKINYLQKKYSVYLKTQPESVTNIKLYQFIDRWLNTPYLWGGIDRRGIDCSAFMQRLYTDVYNIYVPRTSVEQFFAEWIDRFASSTALAEGDLVFFKTMKGKAISHVGFYLGHRMFVNSSSSKGVSIANLDDPYWKTKYVAAGRIKQSMIRKVQP